MLPFIPDRHLGCILPITGSLSKPETTKTSCCKSAHPGSRQVTSWLRKTIVMLHSLIIY